LSLIDKARDFIQYGSAQLGADLVALLLECVEAGTLEALCAVQMLFERMPLSVQAIYRGFADNYLGRPISGDDLKATAAYCLVRWGQAGLDALVEAARRTSQPKNQSLTIEILATLASGEQLRQIGTQVRDEQLSKRVLERVTDWDDLCSAARRHLGTYILSFEDDRAITLAVALQFHLAAFKGPSIPKVLFEAMASRWLAVSIPTLQAFEALLRDHADDEPRFQAFLERHPQMVDPMAFEVWPQPNIHGAKEPDFVIRRTDDTYLVVEIETPSKLLVTHSNKLSADATHAVAQATDYASFLVERLLNVRQQLPSFRQPECLVVIGMERDLNPAQARALQIENENRHRLRIVGFDWLLKRAESIVHNVVAQRITVARGLRIV
jgi:Shedu protein SduA, C-terminal